MKIILHLIASALAAYPALADLVRQDHPEQTHPDRICLYGRWITRSGQDIDVLHGEGNHTYAIPLGRMEGGVLVPAFTGPDLLRRVLKLSPEEILRAYLTERACTMILPLATGQWPLLHRCGDVCLDTLSMDIDIDLNTEVPLDLLTGLRIRATRTETAILKSAEPLQAMPLVSQREGLLPGDPVLQIAGKFVLIKARNRQTSAA